MGKISLNEDINTFGVFLGTMGELVTSQVGQIFSTFSNLFPAMNFPILKISQISKISLIAKACSDAVLCA